VVPALAYGAAQAANCKGAAPPAAYVDAAVALWNETHAGPAVAYLVPELLASVGGVAPFNLLIAGAGSRVSGTTASAKAGKVANVFYAFGPASRATAEGVAFRGSAITFWPYTSLNAPPGSMTVPPRIVMVNTGALLPPPPAPGRHITLHLGPVPSHLPIKATPVLAPKPTSSGAVVAAASVAGVAALAAVLVKTGAIRLPASLARLFR
jgi:hypothetical protein